MTCMGAWRSSKFSQIGPTTAELAEKWCCHFFSAILDQIHFIRAGKDDIHESLDEFEIWPDLTTGAMATDNR